MKRTSLLAFALVTLGTTHAAAWDSKCTVYPDNSLDASKLTGGTPCGPGPAAAQGRLRADKLAEHGDIFRATLIKAGIAAGSYSQVFDTERVPVCTYDLPAPYGGTLRSVTPVSYSGCAAGQVRSFAIDELPMLPDFSYSLSDWAGGNEGCPLNGLKDEPYDRCHDFATDMGPANSNHFPPQSDRAYKRLHASAVAQAKACATMRAKIPGTDRYRFWDLFKSCERSALAIEAVAHHYLQDDWSAGHMWERWGSPEITGYPRLADSFFASTPATDLDAKRLLAQATGAISGLIHGVGPLANDSGVGWAFQDAMCYPSPKVRFKMPSGAITTGAGDDQWSALLAATSGAPLSEQREKLFACGVFSVNEVYDAFGTDPALGARTTSTSPPTVTVASMDECLGMRATNAAFDTGFGIDLSLSGSLVSVTLVDIITSNPILLGLTALGGGVAAAKYDPFSAAGTVQLATEITRLKSLSELNAKYSPDGPQNAKLQAYADPTGAMRLLGVSSNGDYDVAPAYYDPPYPWTGTDDASTTLRRFFHRGDAVQACDDVSGATLAKMKKLASDAPPGAQRDANCALCVEFTSRHLRVGRDASDYDTGAEPLCTFLASKTPAYVYQPMAGSASDARSLASVYCGCDHRFGVVTDKGWIDVVSDKGTLAPTSDAIIPFPTGIPRDAVTVGDYRALVTNSVGDVIALSLRLRKEIDIDGDSSNGLTRMSVKPGTDARGVAVARPTGTKPYALVLSPASQEMVVFDLDTYLECRRFPLGGVDPWDVLVMPDQKKAYVSFRGTVSAPSDLLEVIDVAAATDCTKAIDCSTPGTGCVKSRLSGIFGAKAGLGSMALSPDGSRLAITARRAATCGATVNIGSSSTATMQVGCDNVVAFDTATDKVITLPGSFTGFYRTIPGAYPYAVGFYPDSSRIAYASFAGPDPWPQYPSSWALGFVGAVKTAAWDGKDDYSVALKAGNVVGESLIVESDTMYVGTSSGDITALPTAATFWTSSPASYESSLHGVWYGGFTGACGVGICAKNAPVTLNVASPIRAMLKY